MNINGINRAMKVYDIQNTQKSNRTTNKAKKSDELNLSSSAKDYKFAMEELKKIPDIREDKVKDIKKRIDSGTYSVDSNTIADKIYRMSKGEY